MAAQELSLGIIIGIGFIAVAVFGIATATVWVFYTRRRRRRSIQRAQAWAATKGDMSDMELQVPRNRLRNIFSRLNLVRRKRRGDVHEPAAPRNIQPRTIPMDKPYDLAESPVELDGGEDGKVEEIWGLHSVQQTDRYMDSHAPVPPYTTTAHYRPENTASVPSQLPLDINTSTFTVMPPLSTPRPAAWHHRRSGPPPPLLIAPPETTCSPSDAYSTYAAPSSPYGYYSFNIPLPSSSSNDGITPSAPSAPSFTYSSHSLHSANSCRSIQRLHSPATPNSPGSVPGMSRSNSGAYTESQSLPPPTPTYSQSGSQSQRAPIDSTNFVCLGPLPAHIPFPSPHLPRDQKAAQVELRIYPAEKDDDFISSHSEHIYQDPLLHDTNPLRPHHSPVTPIFTREHSQHAHRQQQQQQYDREEPEDNRRQSTDSLGSNFTVEEEARIQAQIVKNLSMLGQERVIGSTDIVHIPQISERRYSWEE